jgi:putative Mg2+ transporter-C (MgtC) family protein
MENSEIIVRLALAILLGMVIGFERLLGHKEAGMKTHAMVSLGAALFIIISEALAAKYADIGGFDASRMASQIIVGIGFMGAGSIILQGNRLKGLTTAGGFWVTAGIGMAVGFGLFNLAILTTVFVLLVFVLVSMLERPIIKMIEKREQAEDKIQ